MKISAEARRAIDAAMEAGTPITKAPSGALVEPLPGATGKRTAPIKFERRGRNSDPARDAIISKMAPDHTTSEIAAAVGMSYCGVKSACQRLKVIPKAGRGKKGERLNRAEQTKRERAARAVDKVSDRRRFRVTPVPYGAPAKPLPPDHSAAVDGRSVHADRVLVPSDDELVIKDGCNNAKIGGDVLVGRLKGARIYTLTLEERATCPRSCPIWHGCYGNTMHYARRWRAGEALEDRIWAEIGDLCSKHEKVLIRLHVLGDFYSLDYVLIWRALLARYDNLFAFGFTAHSPNGKIGRTIGQMRKDFRGRWFIRHSGTTGPWGSFTIDFPTEKKRIGDAVVCPEQRDAMSGGKEGRHCGNCAICWSSPAPICFVEH